MNFWDSSALVPILVEEPRSPACRRLFKETPEMVVWALTETELLSALRRRRRDGSLSAAALGEALRRLGKLIRQFSEVTDMDSVRSEAGKLLERHALTAADALQLAAAAVASNGEPESCRFICLDERLRTAARQEGFEVADLG